MSETPDNEQPISESYPDQGETENSQVEDIVEDRDDSSRNGMDDLLDLDEDLLPGDEIDDESLESGD